MRYLQNQMAKQKSKHAMAIIWMRNRRIGCWSPNIECYRCEIDCDPGISITIALTSMIIGLILIKISPIYMLIPSILNAKTKNQMAIQNITQFSGIATQISRSSNWFWSGINRFSTFSNRLRKILYKTLNRHLYF